MSLNSFEFLYMVISLVMEVNPEQINKYTLFYNLPTEPFINIEHLLIEQPLWTTHHQGHLAESKSNMYDAECLRGILY